jgi:hypothetical protein
MILNNYIIILIIKKYEYENIYTFYLNLNKIDDEILNSIFKYLDNLFNNYSLINRI